MTLNGLSILARLLYEKPEQGQAHQLLGRCCHVQLDASWGQDQWLYVMVACRCCTPLAVRGEVEQVTPKEIGKPSLASVLNGSYGRCENT